MKHILYVTDVLHPSRDVFRHTVHMCTEMASRLHVFQVIHPQRCAHLLATAQNKLKKAQQMFETGMCAATYAQAGSRDLARECLLRGEQTMQVLQSVAEQAGVPISRTQKIGRPEQEIVDFLTARPDMVMTVFDAQDTFSSRGADRKLRRLRSIIPYRIGIPLLIPTPRIKDKERFQ